MVEGKITESKSGAKLGGQSAFSFSFDTLRHNGAAIPINSQFKSAINSKGKPNVDEEGRMVRRGTGNVAKVGAGTGAGALIGGLTRGGKGAAIGAAVGAAASIVLVEIAADGPNIRFSPGSRLIIEANSRSGPPLSALNAPPPARVEAASAPPPPVQAAAPVAAPPASAGPPQPEFTTLKSTFVPGEKTIFFDDFTDMGPGDAPPHFKTRGAAPELRASGNLRQLTITGNGSLTPNLTALPKNFTCETEVKADAPRRTITNMVFSSKDKEVLHWTSYIEASQMDQVVSMRAPYQELGRKRIPMSFNEPVKMALWVQNGRLRVFINGEKHLDFNQVDLPEITKVEVTHSLTGTNQAFGYRTIRFAESAPDFSQTILSSGRYVTHGILFDTDSDCLKPESAPVIQAIARALENNPNLKLQIEGHTDSVGNPAHNLDLSKRRAEAVKAVLVAQFKVEDGRLTTAGMGSTKPIDSTDTPQGRSQNRRVELVKQ
jgi:OOP family OmpA-OmpF porin